MGYTILNVEQGSAEWHELRRTKIGASDASAILGTNPWKSAAKLYNEKVSGGSDYTNAAMQRGKDLEAEARCWFEIERCCLLSNPVVQSADRPWQIASLDGFCADREIVVEIKCGSEKLHSQAKSGIIPEYYMSQIQHQLSVTGFSKAFYLSYSGFDGVVIPVERDEAIIERLNSLEEAFWISILNLDSPDPEFDTIESEEGVSRLERLSINSSVMRALEAEMKADKEFVCALNGGKPFILNGKKVYESTTTTYDTKAMSADGVDLNKYKKVSKPFWRIA